MKTHMILLAAAATATSVPLLAQPMTPAEFVKTAGASDLYEIRSSQTVLKTTQDPKVRSYAQEMITDHTKSTAQIKAAAAKSKVKASPPALNPQQTEQIAQLNAESGPKRDAAYIAQQKASHNQALAVHKAYSTGGTAPALKTVATGVVPVVEHHIQMLKTM